MLMPMTTNRKYWRRKTRPSIFADELTDEDAEQFDLDPDLGDAYHPFDSGLNICPRCGARLHEPVYPIVTLSGQWYDDPMDSPPGSVWFCPECWEKREALRRGRENVTLDEFEEVPDGN